MPSVLIVDDLLHFQETIEAVIQSIGFSTAVATDGEMALRKYKESTYEVVVADIDMKPMDGISLLRQLKLHDPKAVVVIMTAYTSAPSAVQALKLGAFDYLAKPFQISELIATLRRGVEFKASQTERAQADNAPPSKTTDIESRIIGQSPRMRKVISHLKKLTPGRTPVLLIGEPGTGKSLVARVLHAASGADDASFVRVDCSLSSEANIREGLLGQNGEGGSFVKLANGGTLLLQHLDCLSGSAQKELVSVLRSSAHRFRPVCTTCVDLEKLVDEGKFHDELFYRVASLPIQMPALRERVGDVPLLVKHFTAQAANPGFDANQIEWADDAVAVLSACQWPGNLSELHQVVSQLAATTESRVITAQQLPLRLREIRQWPTLAERFAAQQKEYIDLVLQSCRGDKVAAAKVLGVGVSRLS